MSNSASLYRAFGCFARCAPDSWFPGLAQQHYEVNDLEANERIEEPDASQEDDITDAFNDAGSACEICNDDDAVRSHFAVPCRHTACGSCWGQWLECSDKCMICGGHVEKSHRFAESVVPLSIQERLAKSPQAKTRKGDISEADALEMDVPELYLLNQTLEGVLADVIRDLVKTKDMVTTIAEKIETCTEHLAAIPGMDFDAQMSVIVVEKSTLGEALQALSGCLNRAHSDAWAGTYTGVHRLQQEINKLGDMLDACSDEQPTGLETTRRILQNCTASTLKGQWDPLRQQLNRTPIY